MSTKSRLVRALVFPVMLYGSETWTMKARDKRRINGFEMWCWRRMLRISWTERVTNVRVLEMVKPKERLLTTITRSKLRFFGHIMRADGMERAIMLGLGSGSRGRGRPRARWIGEITTATGLPLSTLREKIQQRREWRKYTMEVTRGRQPT